MFNENLPYWENRYQSFGGNRTVGYGSMNDDEYLRVVAEYTHIISPWLGTPRSVLDFGCGIGRWTDLLKSVSKEYYPCDITQQCDIESFELVQNGVIPFGDMKFDLIWTCVTLQHVIDENLLVNISHQFRNRLSPEGTIILTENVSNNSDSDYLRFRRVDDYIALFQGMHVERLEFYDFRCEETHVIMKLANQKGK